MTGHQEQIGVERIEPWAPDRPVDVDAACLVAEIADVEQFAEGVRVLAERRQDWRAAERGFRNARQLLDGLPGDRELDETAGLASIGLAP